MKHILHAIALIALAACAYHSPAGTDADPTSPDSRIDAALDDPCRAWTFMPAEFDPCFIPKPTAIAPVDLASGTWTLDSATGVLSDGGGTTIELAHVSANGVSIVSVDHLVVADGATLRGVGALPLVLVSWTDITIGGIVDVSSSVADGPGAGANSPACPVGGTAPQQGVPNPATDQQGDGGSGGGGFRDSGGDGGDGDAGTFAGGSDGDARPVGMPPRLQGGCAGADAVTGQNGTPGLSGDGGGGIMLVALGGLTVANTGVVHAGGAGGTGGTNGGQAAGGGGGSGGMIKLEAGSISIENSATLAANGGQGGGGCDNGSATTPGEDGQPDATAALRGNKEGSSGDGGAGGYRDATGGVTGGDGDNNKGGGGGGGGGVGYIVYRGHPGQNINPSAVISPDAMQF